jgi:hypothetical protein
MLYMPAPDFMVAGKFKLQTGLPHKLAGSDIDNPLRSSQLYSESYDQFVKVSF